MIGALPSQLKILLILIRPLMRAPSPCVLGLWFILIYPDLSGAPFTFTFT